MKDYYEALPSNITVKQASTKGLGLFATEDIKEGDILGDALWYLPIFSLKIRTPLGGFASHSRENNITYAEARRFKVPSVYVYTMWATKDIKKGEELFLNYNEIMKFKNLKGEYNGAEWL